MPGDGSASFASSCGRSASNDDFVEVVFCQVELGVVGGLGQLLNGPVGIDMLHRVARSLLGLNGGAVGPGVTAEAGNGAVGAGMEERQHAAAGTQRRAETLDHRPN